MSLCLEPLSKRVLYMTVEYYYSGSYEKFAANMLSDVTYVKTGGML